MALLGLQDVSLAFGGPLLLDGLNLQLEADERLALLGRNGAGKTTLLKVMAGLVTPDRGSVTPAPDISIGFLPQEVPDGLAGSVYDIVLSGLGAQAQLLHDYQQLSHRLHGQDDPKLLTQLAALQAQLDRTGGWDTGRHVDTAITRLHLDPEADFAALSGGQRRRTLLARALVCRPAVLLLDEPTNHLDLDSIAWLEEFLRGYPGTVLFVTHDRAFLQGLATRILELDRGALRSWACDYRTYLVRREEAEAAEATQRAKFDKLLAQEEAWIRQGIKARRTRNEGRVVALEKLRAEKQAQRQQVGQVRLQAQEAERSGRLVLAADGVSFGYGDTCLVRDFSTRIMRGDKIGVIGPNGSGKTTLLRLLLGDLAPQQGTVRHGTNLEVVYYDQLRETLDPEQTVAQNVCGDNDTVIINGAPRNIYGYLQDFLFPRDRARSPVSMLSGGERNRLLLARLFTRPSNLLVMDEPTNDLDIETLELLEQLLLEYGGTLLLVSHDRAFLDNVVTSTLVLEGEGRVGEYPGGYADWLQQRRAAESPAAKAAPAPPKREKPAGPRKLTYNEARELQALPARIEALETEQQDLYTRMADANFHRLDPAEIAQLKERDAALPAELTVLYARWAELEQLAPR